MAFYLDSSCCVSGTPSDAAFYACGLGVYVRVHAAVYAATRSDAHSVMLAQMLHSLRQLGLLSGFAPWCQSLLVQRHVPVLFGLGFLPTGHSLRHSSRSFIWGFLSYRVLPFAATPLFELRRFCQAAAVYAATRSSAVYVAARHSIRLCAEILLAQTRIPLCSLRCCILFSGWGFLSRFVLR